ncbi:hypothetical protein BGW41_000390 [Actinomortierella wolfii]|nr:hypothetical protein BGW41_000390 [Actinomortierella wolfii]
MAVNPSSVFQPLIVAVIILMLLMALISCCRRRRRMQQFANSSNMGVQPASELATGPFATSYPPPPSPLPQQGPYLQPYQYSYQPPPGNPITNYPVSYPPLAHTAPPASSSSAATATVAAAGPNGGTQFVPAQDGASDIPLDAPPPYEAVPKP